MTGPRRVAFLAGVLVWTAGAVAVAFADLDHALLIWTTAALVGALLAVAVPVPWGGEVPLGYALTIAVGDFQHGGHLIAIIGLGVVLAGTVTCARVGTAPAARLIVRVLPPLVTGGVVASVLREAAWVGTVGVLERTLIAGTLVLVIDGVVAQLGSRGRRPRLVPSIPVYLTLLCGASLIAVTRAEQSGWMAGVAAIPLLLTRFSFQRQAGAYDTLQQTVQALGIVPELAGLAPLGHSERTAVYADHVATQLGVDHNAHDRIVTAARLHHLGGVSADPEDASAEPVLLEPAEMAAYGAQVLREAGFPADVADLLEQAEAGTLDGAAVSLEAAAVRIASVFDELVGEDEAQADQALAIIAAHPRDPHSRRAVAALLDVIARTPHLVGDAIAAGARFTEAAAGLDLDALVATSPGGELLHFNRRRT